MHSSLLWSGGWFWTGTTPRQTRKAEVAARQFVEANAVIGMGTDSGSPLNFHTESAWREINVLGYVERVVKGSVVYR